MKTIISILLSAVFLFSNVGCQSKEIIYTPLKNLNYQLSEQDKIFLDTLQYKTFKYFINEINPENGLVKDRSTEKSPATIAATGFAIPIWAIGSEKGWIRREYAAQLTFNLLNFLLNSEQSDDKLATGRKGFYYHFLDMKTGKRFWNCELSSIDSGLLFSGMIFARNYFNQNNEVEKNIRELSTNLLKRADWNFWARSANETMPYQINMGWDEKGFHSLGWFGYTEALFLYVIAAGMDYQNSKEAYKSFQSTYQWREPYTKNFGHVVFPALFAHQYSFLWLNPNGLYDSYMKLKKIDYAENSRRATFVNRQYAIVNPMKWIGYDSLTWGFTACDGPGETYNYDDKKFYGYAARGTSGLDSTEFDDGTIAPTAVGGSIPFAPDICIPTLKSMKSKYPKAWNKYGFVDAFNPTLNWFDPDCLGLDQGPIVIMIENFRNGFVWKYFMKDEIVQKGLKELGFDYQTK